MPQASDFDASYNQISENAQQIRNKLHLNIKYKEIKNKKRNKRNTLYIVLLLHLCSFIGFVIIRFAYILRGLYVLLLF